MLFSMAHPALSCRQHDEAFEAEAEAAVRHRAEAAQVAVPRAELRAARDVSEIMGGIYPQR